MSHANGKNKNENGGNPQPEAGTTNSFPTTALCNFINIYKGDRETLPAFLTNCQNALSLSNDSQKELILKYILARLEGKAQIACSNKVFNTFEDLKCFLKQSFGERKHYNHLLIDLQSCKQLPAETVSQYAMRIETCLTDLQSEIHNSDSLKKELAGRIAMTEDLALHTFTLGLYPRISTIVRARNPRNLNAAINTAIEEEKIQNLYNKNFSTKSGPSVEKRSEYKRVPSTTSSPQPNSRDKIVCAYCKKPGHHISQCRKRQYNNSKNESYQAAKYVETSKDNSGESSYGCESPCCNLNQ